MGGYILRRVILVIPTAFIVMTLAFILMHLQPGDAIMARIEEGTTLSQDQLKKMRESLGLERPLIVQYGAWLWDFVQFDAGKSLYTGRPVMDQLKKAIPVTVELMVLSQILSIIMAVPIGVISALKQDTILDYVLRVFSISLLAAPGFWIATIVVIFGAYWLHWAPPFGYAPLWEDPVTNMKQFLIPSAIIGLSGSASKMRLTRSAVLEVLRQDYIRTARAKGLNERVVLVRHALRNAMIPVVTAWGTSIAALLGGTEIIETIFALPGVGLSMIQAINHNDITQLQANIVFFGIAVGLVNLAIDLSYSLIDKRVSYQ
jgi:peptide/nickel transport system permease protein